MIGIKFVCDQDRCTICSVCYYMTLVLASQSVDIIGLLTVAALFLSIQCGCLFLN